MTKAFFCILSIVFLLQNTSATSFLCNNLVKTELCADENPENSEKSAEENKTEKEQIYIHSEVVLKQNTEDFNSLHTRHNYTSGFLNDPFQPPRAL